MRKKLLLLILLAAPAAAVEIRFHPAEVVYSYEVDPTRGLASVVLQNIAVVQSGPEPVTLDSLEIQVVAQGQVAQTVVIPQAELDASVQRMSAMEAQGVLKLYDFHFQTSRYLDGLRMSPDRTLKAGTALVILAKPLLPAGAADTIVLLARGRDATGQPVEARGSLRVAMHRSPNEYRLSLNGTWWVAGGPNFHSHHRWAANQKFALDLVGLGGDGRAQKGQGLKLDDYYGYGKDCPRRGRRRGRGSGDRCHRGQRPATPARGEHRRAAMSAGLSPARIDTTPRTAAAPRESAPAAHSRAAVPPC